MININLLLKVVDEVNELTKRNKQEVDHSLVQKLEDVKFNKQEILRQKKEVCLEIDNLVTYNGRIVEAIKPLQGELLEISQKCLMIREGRIGIDLVKYTFL